MAKGQAQKSIRDIVRDTFTPSRVGLLSWAFAAVFMGTVGLASYQFSYNHAAFVPPVSGTGGLALPPGGDVAATASTPATAADSATIAVMRLPPASPGMPASDISQGQIEVLQRELVGLRRRLSALSEQNGAYSRRIAALEKQVAFARLSGTAAVTADRDKSTEPGPGVVITKAAPAQMSESARRDTPARKPQPAKAPASRQVVAGSQQKSAPRQIDLYRTGAATQMVPAGSIDPSAPVRIVPQAPAALPRVPLPATSDAPASTGSIPTLQEAALPDEFDAAPTQTTERPKIITPSSPAGRLKGGGDVHLKRSDFGAIIGHFRSTAAAAKAWADFKMQNAERMRDLRPLLMGRQTDEGGIALMVGPFANAADAAIACLHLLDVTELCQPALYAGDPLVTAAQFRDTAF